MVVLGPGRSGTSAIMRAFLAAGFFAGEERDLHGPARTNPLGHFEPLAAIELNEGLLERLGCRWWAQAPSAARQLPLREEAAPRIRSLVDSLSAAAGERPVVIKDPRIGSLLPLWKPVIDDLLHPVLAIRDPLEVAFSNADMEGTSPQHALAAWEAQMTTVLAELEGSEVTIAPFAELIGEEGSAAAIVESARARLAPALADAVEPEKARSGLRPDLRNQDAGKLDHAEYMTRRQLLLWEHLRSLPTGAARLSLPPELRSESRAAQEAMRRESERVELMEAHARLVEALTELNARVAELEGRLADANAAAARESEELARVRGSLSWRLTAPLRRARAARRRRAAASGPE